MAEPISLANVLYKKKTDKSFEEAGNKEKSESAQDNYKDVLEKVIQIIISNHSREFAEFLNSTEATFRLKSLISKYVTSESLLIEGVSIGELTDRLYEDMAGISFVKKYLNDPDVEEININSKDGAWVLYGDRKELIPERFGTPEECISIVKKMARMGNVIIDGSLPFGDSYLSKGVRMSGGISPVTSEEDGAFASIRKQKVSYITKENLIAFGTTTEEELEFLSVCLNNGVSIAIAGATGSGKTADMNYLLSTVDNETRTITIEDTKELHLQKYDDSGRQINDVVQMYTKEPPYPVTMDDLLKLSLRLHPTLLVPAEMRGREAKTVVEAARTGHTALTSLHANSAVHSYDRILTMYLMADSVLSEERILRMIVEAFPIVVFKMQLPDKSRKIVEIFEATDVEGGKVIGNPIFKFKTSGTEKENGRIVKINGEHKKAGAISGKLAERLSLLGVEQQIIEKFQRREQ